MISRIIIALTLTLLLTNSGLYSQWSIDPTVNNPVCTLTSEQGFPAVTMDGSGGSIIVWDDWRNGGNANHDIYAQRMNSAGEALWTLDGVPVCTEENTITNPVVISDGSGGAIIAWVDMRNNATTNYDIYAQRINSSGAILWATDGVVVCTDAASQYNPAITSDGNGGAIITWWDLRNGVFNADIYAQRVDASGAVVWTTDGVAVCTEADEQRYPAVTGDGSNGAIISWQDYTDNDIYVQRLDANGSTQWTASGVAVCAQSNVQFNPTITTDGSGGSIIAWWDNRNGNWDIYAQRMLSNGSAAWSGNGVAVSLQVNDQQSPSITSDGNGGAFIAWVDARNGSGGGYSDIYAQRIQSTGTALWAADVEISTNFGSQYLPAITGTGTGGAVVAWYDYRNNNNDIFVTQVLPDGSLPVELSSFTAEQSDGASVAVRWTTATEVNNHGFEIEKLSNSKISQSQNPFWETIGFVEGNGTSNTAHEYTYRDRSMSAGKYSYRLKQIDRDGSFSYSQQVEVTVGSAPLVFTLAQNYPNPFNPSTNIEFSVPGTGRTTLKVYSIMGQEVATLFDGMAEAGRYHRAVFTASQLSGGVYFAKLTNAGRVQIKRMLLIK